MAKRQLIDIFKQIDRNGPIPKHHPELGPCWNWLGRYNERRRMPEWYCDGQRLIPYRVTWELINGQPWPSDHIVLHQCDNRRCCNPAHYKPGTIAENNAEKEQRERDNGMAHRDVRIVRFLLGYGVDRKSIAKLMEVSVSTIHAIATGQNHSRTQDVEMETRSNHQRFQEDARRNVQQQSEEADEHIRTSETSVRSGTDTFNGEGDTVECEGDRGGVVPESNGDVDSQGNV